MSPARRFVSLAILLFIAVPFGLSVSGCKKALTIVYCNGGDSGPEVGQVATITLSPTLATYGESLDYGQIGQSLSATAQDCKGNSVSVSSYTYASTDGYTSTNAPSIFADINPKTGQVCAGTWNRNTGGGVADYTTCTAPVIQSSSNYLAYVTATANGATSNAIPVFVHPPVTSISIGSPSGSCLIGTEPLTGSTVAGSPALTVSSTTGLAVGEGISGLSLPANTSILAVNTASTLTLSNNATATAATGTVTGSTVAASTTVTLPLTTSTAGIAVGESISGSNIPANTTITAVNTTPTSNTLTISNNATATATNQTLTITLNLTIIGNPTSNCCPLAVTAPGNPAVYTGNSCLSQGHTGQLIASVYDNGSTYAANNITCQVGHLSFAAQGSTNVVTIDEDGVATANQPGSATITASIANAGSASTAGFFSTCPPASITLTAGGQTTPAPITVGLNNDQPFNATVIDSMGNAITGLALEYESTSPQNIPTSSNTVTPLFPGSATITAVCQPGTCNPSPFSQINYLGNGVALTSNGITVTTPGTSSTVLYIGSTSSQYLYPVDFTTNQPASLLKLPYVPNSMVINQSGTNIYLGSSQALMTVSATSNALSSTNTTIVGSVISISPDGTTLVVTDPNKQTVSLVSTSTSAVTTSYGGVATHASWSPDSQTVYITAGSELLVHNTFTSWTAIPVTTTTAYTDVTATVPHVGAFFAGGTLTDARSYCPSSSIGTGNPPTVTNSFYPLAEELATPTDRIAATTDGNHILGASAASTPATLSDINVANDALKVTQECPATVSQSYFAVIPPAPQPLTGVAATAITGVLPASNSDAAFITYTGASTNTAGQLPIYFPQLGTAGAVKLTGSAVAPIAGVFSTDNTVFYVGTSGDNLVHEIDMTYPTSGTPSAIDSGTINPTLPCGVGNIAAPNLTCTAGSTVAPNLIVQRPKKSTE